MGAALTVRPPAENPEVSQGVTPDNNAWMLARTLVLDNERRENFTMLTEEYSDTINPKNEMERGMIEEMAASHWRMRRCWALEARFLNAEMPDDQVSDPVNGPEQRDDDVYVEEMNRQAVAYKKLASEPAFKLILRQQVILQRSFHQTLRALYRFHKWVEEKS